MNHFSIIADGNRRWAKQRGLPITLGHKEGLKCIEGLCLALIARNIKYFSVFCFSTENWNRSDTEISDFFSLARMYLKSKKEWYRQNDIKVIFRGKGRFAADLVVSMEDVEEYTKDCQKLTLLLMVDYGGQSDIVEAINSGARTESEISAYFNSFAPDPDVIVRTGGRHRLSNYMLWQAAYSELFFLDILFPDFSDSDLDRILEEYQHVQKNYGK